MDIPAAELFPQKYPRKVYSVAQVNRIARETLENISCWVHGEVVELEKIKTRFTDYFFKFKLKDGVTDCTLPVILWSGIFENLGFELKDGLEVLVFGNLTLYEKAGIYQFQARAVELFGEGLLQKRFEQLKRKLRAAGYFDEKYKKTIPSYPLKIGVVASELSAAWTDFKKHTVDKFPFLEIVLADVFVQGEQAVSDVVWAIKRLNLESLDLIVITRGGGSLEDLAAFNSEEVAQAIFASKIPVISAIGHERDETIADWVADFSASTPTAAAKIITANFEEFLAKSAQYAQILAAAANRFFQEKLLEISLLQGEFEKNVNEFIFKKRNFLEGAENFLKRIPLEILKEQKRVLGEFSHSLKLLSPQKTLERGYSITYRLPDLKILRNSQDVRTGSQVKIRLARGELKAGILKN